MFSSKVYSNRRKSLVKEMRSGVMLIMGNDITPIDYPSNYFPFTQDPNFLYYTGIGNFANLALIIDIDENKEILFGNNYTIDDEIWMGGQPTLNELAEKSNITESMPFAKLEEYVNNIINRKRKINYLPVTQMQIKVKLETILKIPSVQINANTSEKMIKAVIKQRSIKSKDEVKEIENALDITANMYNAIQANMKPGMYEREIAGMIQGIVLKNGCHLAFPPIVSINGKILHNVYFGNKLRKNDLLLVDSGSRSGESYCADITRTFPVGGKFLSRQRDIYEIVLQMQKNAIKMIKPGVPFRDAHKMASKILVEGLKSIGLMKGCVDDAVESGAHALFFPHGLGHMLGLSAHDMEELGEDLVGYDEKYKRSEQFGAAALRMAREVEPGFVLTVEPGIYFIPKLIDLWKNKKWNKDFINYNKVESYKDFEGIRIEDDLLVTESGTKILGKKTIPKEIIDIEK